MKLSMGIAAIALVAGAALAGAQQAPAGRSQAAAPAGNPDSGRKLFAKDGCYECHGLEAQGATATAPRLGPDPVSFAIFSSYVRRPTGEMPPYTEKVVSAQDLADMYAFVKSVPKPPDARSLPLPK